MTDMPAAQLAADRPRLLRHRRRTHVEVAQPRQPDALRPRLRGELHLHRRRHLSRAGSLRRYVEEPAASAALQLVEPRGHGAAAGLQAGRHRADRQRNRFAELPASVARRLRARPRAGLAVGQAAWHAATMSCASRPAFASTSPWPAPSSCTTARVRSPASPTARCAKAVPTAPAAPRVRTTKTT